MSGFLVNGFREIGRKSNRFGLRRQLAAQERQRQEALAALGRAAWQAGIDLTAFGPQRQQLQKLDARAGELSATAARLEKERTDLEARKQAETARFDGLLQPARGKHAEADSALRAARAALAEKEKAVQGAGAAASQAADVEARHVLAAEVTKRGVESTRAASEVSRLEAEKKNALAPIDADLKRVRQESTGTTRESATVGRDQLDRLRDLGLALYDKKHTEPALAALIEAVAAIDRDRGTTQAAADSSLALTAAMPGGTMAKFWLAILLPIVCAGAAYAAYSRFASPKSADIVEASATPTSGATGVRAEELRKDEAVKALVDSKDPSARSTAVGILEADLMELGSSADRASLPLLGAVLKRGEPELRAAAAHAIGMIGPTRTELPTLVEALNDPAPMVRDAVAQALDQIDDPAGRLLVRRARANAPDRSRSRADGLKPTVPPDASNLGMSVCPGATFLAFASDVGAGRVTFSTPDPIEKVVQFYQKAAGRAPMSGEDFSRAYLGASPRDPSGEQQLQKETEAWARNALQSGQPPAELEAGMIRRMAQLRDLPLVRYADAAIYQSPVFIGFDAPASDGTPVRGRYVAIFEDRSLGRTGFALHVPQK